MENSDIKDWKSNPVTAVFFKSLDKRRNALLEMIGTGRTLYATNGDSTLKESIGQIKLIDEITSASLIRDEKFEESF